MLKTFMRLTALAILFEKLAPRPGRRAPESIDSLSDADFIRIYGIPGEQLLERMGTYDFAPGAVAEMMATVDAVSECEPEDADHISS